MSVDSMWVCSFYSLVKSVHNLMDQILMYLFKPPNKSIFVNLVGSCDSQLFSDLIESIVLLQNGMVLFDIDLESTDEQRLLDGAKVVFIRLGRVYDSRILHQSIEAKYSSNMIARVFYVFTSTAISGHRQYEIPIDQLLRLENESQYEFLKYFLNVMIFNESDKEQLQGSFYILFWLLYQRCQEVKV